jgi:site-specific DNA-cytosine methylase
MPVSDMQAFKQLGNSVSVPVLKAIARQMLKSIKEGKK